MIDRIAPSRQPQGKSAGSQKWRSLLFMHWEIPVSVLRPLVPKELEIDTFEGRGYLGLVPFKMRDIQPNWLPRRMAWKFLETNVRTYVLHDNRPGVYFFSLDANSRLAVWAARAGWRLPYRFARMSSADNGEQFAYASARPGDGAAHHVCFRVGAEQGVASPGTLEHFLLERYLLFVVAGRKTMMGQVHHRPYPVHLAEVDELRDGLIEAAGFTGLPAIPDHVRYSPGVDVQVYPLIKQ
jgi:uncharacterized protein YqjF (DUF2071 family)